MPDSDPRGWLDGHILAGGRPAEALLTEAGEVVATGTEAQVRRAAPTGTSFHRLRGRCVVPGLIDLHLHWLDSVVERTGVALHGCAGVPQLQAAVAAATRRAGSSPLVGGGWDQERFPGRRFPTRTDLDRACAERPVVLYRVCHHAAVVNSRALEAAGISRVTPDPPGGRIDRGPDGEPTGLLFDQALRWLRPFSVAAFQDERNAALGFLRELACRGLTTVGPMSALPVEVERARDEARSRELPVALRFYLRWDERTEVTRLRGRSDDLDLRLCGLKLALDGSLGARTAWLGEPYSDSREESGFPLVPEEEVTEAARTARALDLDLALHAIGDRALGVAVPLVEADPDRVRVEHASIAPPALQDRLARARARIVIQPRFPASDTWIPERLGDARRAWAYPFRALRAGGARLAGSSDAPVEPFDPWSGLAAATRHAGFSAEEALDLYTAGAGEVLGEPLRGTLRPGAPADLVVLDAPTLEAAIAAEGPVLEVYRGGRRVAPEGAI